MKVLVATAEASPFAKRGGLGDVLGALPIAIKKQSEIDIRVVLPGYSAIPSQFKSEFQPIDSIIIPLGWRAQKSRVSSYNFRNVTFYFIENDYYFNREDIYGYFDEAEQFGFFSKAILDIMPLLDFYPDIIHLNDWHTAMVSPLLKYKYAHKTNYNQMKTILTIHNLKYQGIFTPHVLEDFFDLHDHKLQHDPEYLEYHGQISFLKGGLIFSDAITTVSPTYAKEIQSPELGMGVDGLLHKRRDDLYGILNGIDYQDYNPKTDVNIYRNYNLPDEGKTNEKLINKLRLQEDLRLPVSSRVPLIAFINRLVKQKGLDLITYVLPELLESEEVQFVFLGTGDPHYEQYLSYLAEKHQNLSAQIKFDEGLARKIYAASDLFLMPSLFEPCGIGQQIAIRYGSVPIVRKVGGLHDTVYPSISEEGTRGIGFTFESFNAHEMLFTIKEAIQYYHQKAFWQEIINNLTTIDFSWEKSACEYIELYHKLIHRNTNSTRKESYLK
ncbi:glycogen synthase GlgA [Natranaerobius thermophilus]|uniref:Glycogen synthase n=1 Tax=Natranaerobius thermophilus (strain ATCC BAA-1301 / DSM 18059 / JW/NM-WN-LF) TaxID=457570 RepID=GLGA_NATTJ|nr:glycogen synthase GlgA [Natranaerobius thermophilus]B2A6E4.1 RecName: Full=Glycogen synthase; AltName: Full=Starch [bacterial glycogen] synthase [Natranaerobius thermophilus JW/NM-WN-LF]ACB84155.1 glycogen/starch synthase, ADP-glucose type [Natranaerobius thermophilus JW/NM-WN-LF]